MDNLIEMFATANANMLNAYQQMQKENRELKEALTAANAKLAIYEQQVATMQKMNSIPNGPIRSAPKQNTPEVDSDGYPRIPPLPFETKCDDQEKLNYEAMSPGYGPSSGRPLGSK